jgi:competence protein ComEA
MLKQNSSLTLARAAAWSSIAALALAFSACSAQRASDADTQPNKTAQQQEAPKPDNHKEAEDNGRKLGEKAREAEIRTREDRTKLKEGAREAGKKIKKGTEELASKASAAAQGMRQGWNQRNQNPNAVDINHASSTDLIALGLSHADTNRIIKGRPYKSTQELPDRGILSPATYRGIADKITAK